MAGALVEQGVEQIYTGHCTGPAAFAVLKEQLGTRLEALTTGLTAELP